MTYSELAAKINQPTAYRAVGLANSLNPIAIAIPCHRVIGTNNQLTGYAGGIECKRWLLRHEVIVNYP
ncbi:methylated-DNA--[protein]-cysteine S-methyltransferase [Nostoc sp. PCC 7524]|uniref:methylated-DNA--[protein]-cysteine S-methyltransferase n=1 Tax=Nostoc sp. (strain ATCC 29411 / PCC 7524) TaxID=28072 RepID=UPI000A029BA6|nr:methylated-DNA--[protein]-cysteine S-methyltransferase [Nostoc sp. PCC 7524]